MLKPRILLALALAAAAAPAGSTDAPSASPALFGAMTQCLAVAGDPARLACYDRTVQALDAAVRNHDIMVIDRALVRDTKKSLFGLAVPTLAIFGDTTGKEDRANEITEIESTVARADLAPSGAWTLTLADGARWRQTDDNVIGGRPRPGDKVVIRKAALGSYKLTVGGQPAVRVRREN